MNLGNANVVLRPRGTLESLDLTLLFLTRLGGRPYGLLSALVLLPAVGVCLGLQLWFALEWANVWLIALPLGLWLQGVFTLAAGDLMFSDVLEPRSVLRRFRARLAVYSLALLGSRLLMALAAFTLLLWPWAWLRYTFIPEALLLEGLSVPGATGRAARLQVGMPVERLGLCFTMLGGLALALLGAQVLGHGIVHDTLQLQLPWGDLLQDGGSAYAVVGWFAALPVLTTLRFLRYIDARTRADAWDVQVRLQRAAQAPEAA
ncbi:MAG: hypothetical protein ABI895_42000 [Deltaproteobacteria bacterium]